MKSPKRKPREFYIVSAYRGGYRNAWDSELEAESEAVYMNDTYSDRNPRAKVIKVVEVVEVLPKRKVKGEK